MVSTTTPDPKHVDPYRFATPDGERDASRKCSMRRPVLDKDEGEKRLCPEGFGCLSLIESEIRPSTMVRLIRSATPLACGEYGGGIS